MEGNQEGQRVHEVTFNKQTPLITLLEERHFCTTCAQTK